MAASKKRRSSFFPQRNNHNDSFNETPYIDDANVDEETERKNRMKLQKRQSIGPGAIAPATPNVENNAGSIARCTQAELADMYTNCMKLSAENKISVKNAFQLKLIDYMAEMMKTKKKSEMDNFQSASCALDASTKIYAYRVDSVHSDTLKLAGGVGDTNKENEGNKNNTEGAVDNDDPEEGEKKKAKRKKKSATVEKNLNNIDIAKFDLEFDVDPLFKKTSTQFDSGSGGGQFLCNLFIRDESCQLLLDSEAFLPYEGQELPPEDDLAEDMVKIESNPEVVICPSFAKFSFKNWSLENEDPAFLNLSLHNDEADESLKALDEMKENDENEGDHFFDVNAPPVEDLGDDSTGAGGFLMDDNDDVTDEPKETRGLGMELVANLKQRLTNIPNEYSYFDHGRLGAWAGPRHWKFKPMSKFAVPGLPKTDKKKAKDPLKPHNYEDLFDEESEAWRTVEKTTRINKKPVQLQNKTMVNWSEERLLLPADLNYRGKDFAQLFVTPELLVTNKGAVIAEAVDESIAEYDYDNANDVDEFCPDLPNNPDAGNYDEGEGEGGYFPSQSILPTQTQGEFLVSAPNRVEKIQIGYAKQAKKMDMKRLKAVEWSILQTSCIEQDKENDTDNVNEAEKKKNNETGVESSTSFSHLYTNLAGSRLMPTKMSENLSVPLAFVALLHLCNERCLALSGVSDFSDFNIRQG